MALGLAAIILRKKFVFLSLAVGFFLLGNLIESSILNLELAFIHRLYLPSIFFYLGMLAHIPARFYRIVSVVIICVFAFFTFSTLERNNEWRNGDIFWQMDITRGGSIGRSSVNYAANLITQGRYSKASDYLQHILKNADKLDLKNPRYQEHIRKMQYLLGQSYFLSAKYEQAIYTLRQLYNETGDIEHLYYLSMAKLHAGIDFPVKNIVKEIRQHNPVYACLLGAQYLETQGHYDEQEKLLSSCGERLGGITLADRNTLKMYLANAYIKQHKFDDAKQVYLQITGSNPENIVAWQQLYRMMLSGNNPEEANKIKRLLNAKGAAIPSAQ
jgi:predicted Zn-dependent protease